MLALLAANGGAPVAGVAMLSGQGRPMLVVLREQLSRQADSATLAAFDSKAAIFLRGEDPGELPLLLQTVFVPQYRRLIQGLAAYDPGKEIAQAKVSLLIVQGGMDIQITADDANALRANRRDATFVLIPAANHVYKAVASRELSAQIPAYQDPTLPIGPELVSAIVDWISRLERHHQ
jgi:hypothetical protein